MLLMFLIVFVQCIFARELEITNPRSLTTHTVIIRSIYQSQQAHHHNLPHNNRLLYPPNHNKFINLQIIIQTKCITS